MSVTATARATGLLAVCALLAACGTRLPDRDFAVSGQIVDQPGAVVPGASAGPSASASAAPGSTPEATGPGGVAAVPSSGPGGTGGGGVTANFASDIGVTATTIRLGLVSSRSNPFDPAAFIGTLFGAQAYFSDLNARGGVNGRQVQLTTCDDHGDGSRNQTCIHSLIDDAKVFAFVSQAIFRYDGASYVQQKGVPDIGSQPIDTAYARYHHLWDLYGETYKRDGTTGYNGKLQGNTEVYRFFKEKYPKEPLKAGVVYYNEADSQRFGESIATGLRKEGYTVVTEQVNFALPNFDSAVLDMKNQGVRFIFDTLDSGGNQNLCKAMDSGGLSSQAVAKVTTTQSWVASIATDYSQSPLCRNKIWATGNTLNYEDTSKPQVKAFRDAMARQHTDGTSQMSEWAIEGWAGAQWATDAIASCGAKLTRTCVETYMNRQESKWYNGHGMLTPRDFKVVEPAAPYSVNCINVARWQDSSNGGRGGWVTQVPDMMKNCYDVPGILYSP